VRHGNHAFLGGLQMDGAVIDFHRDRLDLFAVLGGPKAHAGADVPVGVLDPGGCDLVGEQRHLVVDDGRGGRLVQGVPQRFAFGIEQLQGKAAQGLAARSAVDVDPFDFHFLAEVDFPPGIGGFIGHGDRTLRGHAVGATVNRQPRLAVAVLAALLRLGELGDIHLVAEHFDFRQFQGLVGPRNFDAHEARIRMLDRRRRRQRRERGPNPVLVGPDELFDRQLGRLAASQLEVDLVLLQGAKLGFERPLGLQSPRFHFPSQGR